MSNPNSPIVNAGFSYVTGLGMAYATTTTLTVATGQARDSTNVNDIINSASLTFTSTVVGANGVDVAALTTSSVYALYIIGSSVGKATTACLASLSATTPTLPLNYDMFRRIGWIFSDGSSHIIKFWQIGGTGGGRKMYWDVAVSVLSAGTSTTYANVDLSTAVPPLTSSEVNLIATYTPNSATNVAHMLIFGSTATNGMIEIGGGVAAAQVSNIVVPSALNTGKSEIQYKVQTSDTLSLSVSGFTDYL